MTSFEPAWRYFGDHVDEERLIAIRDSKDPEGSVLFLSRLQWQALIRRIKAGDFDLP